MQNETIRKPIVLLGAFIFFAVAAFFSLYEGSQLDDVSWEWPHSAIFTNWLNGSVSSADDILTIDYLVYAAKFEPLFPIVMFVSGMIVFLQLAFWVFRGKKVGLSVFLLLAALVLLVGSGVLMASPTDGLQLFSGIFLGSGVLMAAGCVFLLVQAKKHAQ